MQKEFEDNGMWSVAIPETNEVLTHYGKLTWSPTAGATVELYGLTNQESQKLLAHRGSKFWILGQLNSIPLISIWGALISNSDIGLAAPANVTLEAGEMMKGDIHITDLADAVFETVTIDATGLAELVGGTLITSNLNGQNEVGVCVGNPILEDFSRIGEVDVRILRVGNYSRGIGKFSAHDEFRIELHSPSGIPYSTAISLIHEIRDFLTLALDMPVSIKSIRGALPKKEGHTRSASLEIFRQTSSEVLKLSNRKIRDEQILFGLRPYERSGPALAKFHTVRKSIRMALDFFFSGYYAPDSYINQKFADVVHGLEGLHRGLRGGHFGDQEVYDKTIYPVLAAAIPASVTGDFRRSLQSRLKFGNEVSLRRRLKELVRFHRDYLSPFVGTPDQFSAEVAELRNSLAHANSDKEPSEETALEFALYYHKARLLFQVELLHQLGFPGPCIADSVKRMRSGEAIFQIKRLLRSIRPAKEKGEGDPVEDEGVPASPMN